MQWLLCIWGWDSGWQGSLWACWFLGCCSGAEPLPVPEISGCPKKLRWTYLILLSASPHLPTPLLTISPGGFTVCQLLPSLVSVLTPGKGRVEVELIDSASHWLWFHLLLGLEARHPTIPQCAPATTEAGGGCVERQNGQTDEGEESTQ